MPPCPAVVSQFSAPYSQYLRLWKRVLACCVLASFSALAETDRNPVEQLYSACKATVKSAETPDGDEVAIDTMAGQIACTQYLSGLTDGVGIGGTIQFVPVCVPKGTEYQRLARIVVKYIDDYPGSTTEGKAEVAVKALVAAYPCPTSK